MAAPRLRTSLLALGGVLLVASLVTAAALAVLTTVIKDETAHVAVADARMRSALQTKIALLGYAQASDVALSTRSQAARDIEGRELAQAEAELRSRLADTRRLAVPEQLRDIDDLTAKTEAYVALRTRLQDQGLPVRAVVERATPSLDAAFGVIEQLIASDETSARGITARAERWDSLADGIGISAAALQLAGFAIAVVGAGMLVEAPLLALTRAMSRFASGDEASRAVPLGARELQQVAATFDELADRLVRQKQERLAFVAAVAHDLRNPLSALKLAGDALQRGPQPPDPERVSRTLATVARQVKQLDRMVGDLLDATRVQSGRFELRLQDVDLRALVQHVAELFRPASELHRVVLVTPEQPIVVRGDATRIEQVMNNLVSNAIKYSPRGGQVTIAASMSGAEAVVAVTDEGLGIAREELPHVFEPFHRGVASRELVQGVGLGLAVARRLVEAHGGRLEVESQPGKGSTFRVRLPAGGQAAQVG